MPASRPVRVRACAKINLTLRLLGTRPDGYHELRTVFQSLALHDTLIVTRRRGPFEIVSHEADCPCDPSNLVWRAAEAMWREAGRVGAARDVSVTIVKRIPAQAGLGGGSSDAAAALRTFAGMWRVNVDEDRLRQIGAGLGADVPFFLMGGTALGLDRGDTLFPLADFAAHAVLLVVPPFAVSTREAYGWWDADAARQAGPSRRLGDVQPGPGAASGRRGRRGTASWSAGEWVNDLEAPVAARHPEIAELVGALGRAGASYAAMSGSGSAVFGLFPTVAAAKRAVRRLAARGRRVLVTRTIGRVSYLRSTGRGLPRNQPVVYT